MPTIIENDPEPTTRVVQTNDPAASAVGASSLISTIVWSVVVLVLLAVALYALHFYLGWF